METFSWEAICDIEVELPPIEVQQKYVGIYNATVENQKVYERGLEDLKLSIDAIIEKFKYTKNCVTLGEIIEESDIRNTENVTSTVHGVNKEKNLFRPQQSGRIYQNIK